MESEEALTVFGKAADFNRDMYQINIASMDVLMQLVQVVDSMREGQGFITEVLERVSDDGPDSQGELTAARQATAETEAPAGDLSKKLQTLVRQVDRMNALYGT